MLVAGRVYMFDYCWDLVDFDQIVATNEDFCLIFDQSLDRAPQFKSIMLEEICNMAGNTIG